MPLASEAHVSIAGEEFMLDQSVEDHYRHSIRQIMVPKLQIAGDPGKEQIHEDRLLWAHTDWTGGEGNRVWYEDQANVYDVGNGLHGRVPGQLSVRPRRERTTLPTNDVAKQVYFTFADGTLWAVNDDRAHYSTDSGENWASLTAANTGLSAIHADLFATACVGDDAFVYIAGKRSGKQVIVRTNTDGEEETVLAERDGAPIASMTIFNGRLYAWTGRKLIELDIASGTMPLGTDKFRQVYNTGVDPQSAQVQGAEWHAEVFEADNRILFYYSSEGISNLYQYNRGVGRPLWRAPIGFNIHSAAYNEGTVFCFGHWGVIGNQGPGAMYTIPMDTMKARFAGYIRQYRTGGTLMSRATPSYGPQIMTATPSGGKLFVYDNDFAGISMLDDLEEESSEIDSLVWVNGDERIGDMITTGEYRLVGVFNPGGGTSTTIQILRYYEDDPDNREDDKDITDAALLNYLETAEWDYNFPLEAKVLHGFWVSYMVEDRNTTSGLVAGQRIHVKYKVDGEASWTTAGTLTSSSTPEKGTLGLAYIQVTTDVSIVDFMRLKLRFEVDNNTTDGVKPPIIYGVIAESSLLPSEEEWELVVRVKDEPADNARPTSRQDSGPTIRDRLIDIVEQQSVVSFLDGYRYGLSLPANYSTHRVKILEMEDMISKWGEGNMRLRLKAVPSD